jgi:hypothetical protein
MAKFEAKKWIDVVRNTPPEIHADIIRWDCTKRTFYTAFPPLKQQISLNSMTGVLLNGYQGDLLRPYP